MKIKLINKIWKLSFVGLIISVGFGLSGCGSTNAKAQQIERYDKFYHIERKAINDLNNKQIDNFNKSNNYISLSAYSYNPNTDYFDIGWLYINVNGIYHLTGNAQNDWDNLRKPPITLFKEIKNNFNQLIASKTSASKDNFKVVVKFPDFIFMLPDGSKYIHSKVHNLFHDMVLPYSFKNADFIYDKSQSDNDDTGALRSYKGEK